MAFAPRRRPVLGPINGRLPRASHGFSSAVEASKPPRRQLPGARAVAGNSRTHVLINQLANEQVDVQRAAVQELFLLASSSEVCRLAIGRASGDRALIKLVHQNVQRINDLEVHRSQKASAWALLRWSFATMNALAVDDFSRRRQGSIVESVFNVCARGADDADRSAEKRSATFEGCSLLANLTASTTPRAQFDRMGGTEKLLSYAAVHPASGLLKTLQRAGLVDRSFTAPGQLSPQRSFKPLPPLKPAKPAAGFLVFGSQVEERRAHSSAAAVQSHYRGHVARRGAVATAREVRKLEAAEATRDSLTAKLEAGHMLLPDEIAELKEVSGYLAKSAADELVARLQDGQMLGPEELAVLREATATSASTTADRIMGKLARGHMLDAAELSELRASNEAVAEIKADDIATKLASGHMLTDAELAELKGAALGSAGGIGGGGEAGPSPPPTPPTLRNARTSKEDRAAVRVQAVHRGNEARRIAPRPPLAQRSTGGASAAKKPEEIAAKLASGYVLTDAELEVLKGATNISSSSGAKPGGGKELKPFVSYAEGYPPNRPLFISHADATASAVEKPTEVEAKAEAEAEAEVEAAVAAADAEVEAAIRMQANARGRLARQKAGHAGTGGATAA